MDRDCLVLHEPDNEEVLVDPKAIQVIFKKMAGYPKARAVIYVGMYIGVRETPDEIRAKLKI